eukprot:5895426-Amphidinium_carterae.2
MSKGLPEPQPTHPMGYRMTLRWPFCISGSFSCARNVLRDSASKPSSALLVCGALCASAPLPPLM